jgi:acetyl esterase/lipase
VGRLAAAGLLAALLAAVPLAPASADEVAEPPGPAPLRFRDEVFSRIAVTHDLVYGSAPGGHGRPVRLLLDLYRPRGDRLRRRPVMVWVHGGGFRVGDKATTVMRRLAMGTARRGYVSVSVDYRLLVGHGCATLGPDCGRAAVQDQHDVQAAIRWVRRNARRYRLDPGRVAVGGESVGGVLAYMVGTRAGDPGTSGNPGFSSRVCGFVSISGGYPGGRFATSDDAPGLLFHGTADDVVPYRWSSDAARALRRARVPVVFESLPGAGHVRYDKHHRRYDHHTAWFLYRVMALGAHSA